MEIQKSSSEIMRKEILQQSRTEAEGILEQARKEEARLVEKGRQEAEAVRAKAMKAAEEQAEGIRRRVLSGVHLEVKKQQLINREKILSRVLDILRDKMQQFRQRSEYRDFLSACVTESVMAIEDEQIGLQVNKQEREILEKGLLQEIQQRIQQKTGRPVQLRLLEAALEDGGVIAFSKDERTRYDNSFSAQLKRKEDEIRLMVVKEVLSQN